MRFIRRKQTYLAGLAAGSINGLFGAGGGMVLVPFLQACTDLKEEEVFPSSVAVILPLCVISLTITAQQSPLPLKDALPYLIGSLFGGCLAGMLGKRIPTTLLHRLLGILIIWGGVQTLC